MSRITKKRRLGIQKGPNNFIWWFFIVILLGPALYIAWQINIQPSENLIIYDMERPDEGQAFDIQRAVLEEQTLILTVNYSGGCGDHLFDMYVNQQQSDVKRTVQIHHTSDEQCDELVVEDLKYDVSSVIEEHDGPQVVFTILGNGMEPDAVLYIQPK